MVVVSKRTTRTRWPFDGSSRNGVELVAGAAVWHVDPIRVLVVVTRLLEQTDALGVGDAHLAVALSGLLHDRRGGPVASADRAHSAGVDDFDDANRSRPGSDSSTTDSTRSRERCRSTRLTTASSCAAAFAAQQATSPNRSDARSIILFSEPFFDEGLGLLPEAFGAGVELMQARAAHERGAWR